MSTKIITDYVNCFTPECRRRARNFFLLHIKKGTRKGEHALTAVCEACAKGLRDEEKSSIMSIETFRLKEFFVAKIMEDHDMISYFSYPPWRL